MTQILSILGQVMLLVGAAIFLLAAIGLFRFRDPYARISAVATAGGLGLVMITLGALFQNPNVTDLVKVIIAVILQLLTSAVGATVIARAAVNTRHEFSRDTDIEVLDMRPADDPMTEDPKRSHGSQSRNEEPRSEE